MKKLLFVFLLSLSFSDYSQTTTTSLKKDSIKLFPFCFYSIREVKSNSVLFPKQSFNNKKILLPTYVLNDPRYIKQTYNDGKVTYLYKNKYYYVAPYGSRSSILAGSFYYLFKLMGMDD